jgi:hypothetical protein
MSSRRRQSGEGKAGCIFWAVVFLILGLAGWGFIPAKIADMQLVDYVDELAKLNPREKGDWYERMIYKRADDLRIPLARGGKGRLKVDKTLQRVRVELEYTIEIDFIVTSFPWEFKHFIERDIFII